MGDSDCYFDGGTYESPFRFLFLHLELAHAGRDSRRKASHRLFALADSPEAMMKLTTKKIEKTIFPVGFYRTKEGYSRDLPNLDPGLLGQSSRRDR